jgi:uncharacterized protein YutE (UPF0331/DUF86 family)
MRHNTQDGRTGSGADNTADLALVAEVYHECFRALVADEYTPDEAAEYLQSVPSFRNILQLPIRL